MRLALAEGLIQRHAFNSVCGELLLMTICVQRTRLYVRDVRCINQLVGNSVIRGSPATSNPHCRRLIAQRRYKAPKALPLRGVRATVAVTAKGEFTAAPGSYRKSYPSHSMRLLSAERPCCETAVCEDGKFLPSIVAPRCHPG
jgi:hypothetical protein